jgi:hypothetical protein
MIEAVPVLMVAAVAVISYTAARLHVANPANRHPERDLTRLQDQRSWLQQRLQRARCENWDQEMVTRIADELESIEAQLIALEPSPPKKR